MVQPIDNRQKLINTDGTPTEYFIRVLRDRGLSADDIATEVQALNNTIAQFGLDDLIDVDISTTPPANGEVLKYDAGLLKWVPGVGGGGGGGDPTIGVELTRTADSGSTSGAYTISWTASPAQDGGLWAIADPTKVTIPLLGWYAITFATEDTNTSPGRVSVLDVRVNGVTRQSITQYMPGAFSAIRMAEATLLKLNAGDIVTFVVQTYGGSTSYINSKASVVRVGQGGGGASGAATVFVPVAGANFNAYSMGTAEQFGGTITKTATGRFTFTFTTPRANTNYYVSANCGRSLTGDPAGTSLGAVAIIEKTTAGFKFNTTYSNGLAFDYEIVNVQAIALTTLVVGNNGGSGTAFPSTPTLDERFYRSDRKIEYYWDGSRWLSTELYTFSMPNYMDLSNATIGGSRAMFYKRPFCDIYSIWIETASSYIYKTGGTWTITVSHEPTPGAAAVTIGTHTFTTNLQHLTVSNIVNVVSSGKYVQSFMSINNFGICSSEITYRLIG